VDLSRYHQENRDKEREESYTEHDLRIRAAKIKAQEEYTAADKDVNKSVKKDKKDYIENWPFKPKMLQDKGI
jgi:hypothetical protein